VQNAGGGGCSAATSGTPERHEFVPIGVDVSTCM